MKMMKKKCRKIHIKEFIGNKAFKEGIKCDMLYNIDSFYQDKVHSWSTILFLF